MTFQPPRAEPEFPGPDRSGRLGCEAPARLSALSAWFSPWRSWRERRLTTDCCQQLVAVHDRIAEQKPWLRGRALYLHVVAEVQAGDFEQAARTLSAAEDSYAIWPTDRPLTFVDVAHYLAVARCQQAAADGGLIASDVRPLVESLVGRHR